MWDGGGRQCPKDGRTTRKRLPSLCVHRGACHKHRRGESMNTLQKQYLTCIGRERRGLTGWERDCHIEAAGKAKARTCKSAVCSALGTCGPFHFPFMLIQCFRPPYLPRTIDLLVFTPHYHLFSLYFHLNFLFLEGRKEVMNINVLDLKRGMINYDL